MDDALRRTADAVRRYQVPDRMIALAAASVMRMPAGYRRRVEVEALTDAVLGIADTHGGTCDDTCLLCVRIRDALAVTMGIIRAEVDLEFQERLDG